MVFFVLVGLELINVDKIVGVFLVGLVVNDVLGNSFVKEKVEFLGIILFILFFFIGIGLLLDLLVFLVILIILFFLVVVIVVGLIFFKGVVVILV